MYRFNLMFTLLVALAVIWGCSEDASLLSDSISSTDARFGEGSQTSRIGPDIMATYEIRLDNLSPATGAGASQPFSPPVVVTHAPLFHLYKPGRFASAELAEIAQDANSGPMLDLLNHSDRVLNVAMGDGVILPETSATIEIMAKPGFHKLSLVTMLVNTNDAFTGVDALKLPRSGSKTMYLRTYDAGSEKNTESMDHIPGPCCGNPFMGIETRERVHFHMGITGHGDLDPNIYGWNDPVARLTITRVE